MVVVILSAFQRIRQAFYGMDQSHDFGFLETESSFLNVGYKLLREDNSETAEYV
jgi:hypothetical protein